MSDRPQILVVDDDSRHLAMVDRVLRRSDFEVTTAHGGRAGLRAACKKYFDLVLIDVQMPRMSGHEFLRHLRRLEHRRFANDLTYVPMPAIFVSGLDKSHNRVDGLNAGAIDYIVKPFDAQELRARVRCQLRNVYESRQAITSLAMINATAAAHLKAS